MYYSYNAKPHTHNQPTNQPTKQANNNKQTENEKIKNLVNIKCYDQSRFSLHLKGLQPGLRLCSTPPSADVRGEK